MIRRDLRASIAISLVFFILLGMVLLDFVMIGTQQRMLIQKERERGKLFLSFLSSTLLADSAGGAIDSMKLTGIVRRMFHDAGYSCFLMVDESGQLLEIGAGGCGELQMMDLVLEAKEKNEVIDRVRGAAWGVFWRQPRYLILAAPLAMGENNRPVVSLAADLESVFAGLRKTQAILLLYILANTLVLAFLGFYRISALTVKPLQKLLKRADEYNEADDFFFLQEQGENEYTRLSRSLNRMLARISRDRDDLKHAVRRLEAANLDLKNAQESVIRAEKLASVGRLTSGIAHEIGNPVGIVTGYLDLLRPAGLSDAEREAYLSRAQAEVERIRKIIRELLDFSRPDGNTVSQFQCHDVIGGTVDSLAPQPLFKGIDIRLQLEAESGTLAGDPDRFRQVMLNLLLNASDAVRSVYPETGGHITVKTVDALPKDGSEKWIEVAVSDNGTGIPKSDLANVFDPFFTTKETGKGTGLGLAVSYMIVERMGGRMDVESDAGSGTTIKLRLPLSGKTEEDT